MEVNSFITCMDCKPAIAKAGTPPADLGGGTWFDLYEQHSRYVYYLALRTVRDAILAEDITHDVFLKAFRNLEGFRGQASLRTWLYRVTINRCRTVQSTWHERNVISTDRIDVLDGPSTNTEDPLRVLEIKELGQRIQTALDALSSEYCLLLLLVADEQLSYQEVATLTEQSAEAVRGKLYRARRAFLEEFRKTE